jgi:hypothetical protein
MPALTLIAARSSQRSHASPGAARATSPASSGWSHARRRGFVDAAPAPSERRAYVDDDPEEPEEDELEAEEKGLGRSARRASSDAGRAMGEKVRYTASSVRKAVNKRSAAEQSRYSRT